MVYRKFKLIARGVTFISAKSLSLCTLVMSGTNKNDDVQLMMLEL